MKNKLILIFLLSILSCTYSKTNVDIIDYYGVSNEKELDKLVLDSYNEGKVPIVYFYADWCGPCKASKRSLKNENVEEALKNARLIKINVDIDDDLIALKYNVRSIPTYFKMDENGEILARITSSKWKKDIPENIAPVLDSLVNISLFNRL